MKHHIIIYILAILISIFTYLILNKKETFNNQRCNDAKKSSKGI